MYSIVQYSTTQYSAAQHSTAQHSTAQHSTAQHSTVQYSAVQYNKTYKQTMKLNVMKSVYMWAYVILIIIPSDVLPRLFCFPLLESHPYGIL